MAHNLTQAAFTQNLHTKFRVRVEAPRPIELELAEVAGWRTQPEEQRGMERFSLTFYGPGDLLMPQQTYTLEHEQMGELQVFLVPVRRDPDKILYEAVFNYFTDPQ